MATLWSTIIMKYTLISLIVLIAFITPGCVSQFTPFKEATESWIGATFERRSGVSEYFEKNPALGGVEKKTDGSMIYKEPIREGCVIFWNVNPEGIIVDYRTEGDRCY